VPRVKAGDITLNYTEHGSGDNVVLAVHGNLGCAEWLALVLPLLPANLRVIVAEWRGCGDSDKPEPENDYSNYTFKVHSSDMIALADALGVGRCHLYGHSTGGIIVSHMLTMTPERFGKVLMLDPVTPLGLSLAPGQLDVLMRMKRDRDFAFAGMASAAPTLFRPETMVAGQMPQYSDATTAAQRQLFDLLVERTRILSDGVWFGTPHNLALEFHSGALAKKMPDMTHEHLIVYGKLDYWVPREHVDAMAQSLPNCRLEVFPYVGHSMNIEQPLLLARIFTEFFRCS